MLSLLPLCLNAQTPQITPFAADCTIEKQVKISINGKLSTPTIKIKGKLYVARDAKRSEGARGRESITIYNVTTKTSTWLLDFNKSYVQHTPRTSPPWTGPDFESPWDPTNPCAPESGSRCESLGVEAIDGRSCEHWKITDKDGAVYYLWVDKVLNYPSRVTTQKVYSWKLTNIREGEQDPALFQVPDGYQKAKCERDCVE
jgi:hypothetical protein